MRIAPKGWPLQKSLRYSLFHHSPSVHIAPCLPTFLNAHPLYCSISLEVSSPFPWQDTDQSALRKQYLSLKETVSSLNSLNATLEEAATTRQEEVNKMEQLMAKFKEEREQLISQVCSLVFFSFSWGEAAEWQRLPRLGLKNIQNFISQLNHLHGLVNSSPVLP